jgi:O-acetyl-ADP-ribose deacetylase (regulator of RNase III)
VIKDNNRQFPTSAQLKFVDGDATNPVTSPFCIIHICNNVGGWGAGFVLAISKKWKEPEREYRKLKKWKLGEVQWVSIDGNFVVNMIAQDGFMNSENKIPLDYDALDKCLEKVYKDIPPNYTVHLPRMGTGLAGGKWEKVQELIQKHMKVNSYVYDFR